MTVRLVEPAMMHYTMALDLDPKGNSMIKQAIDNINIHDDDDDDDVNMSILSS